MPTRDDLEAARPSSRSLAPNELGEPSAERSPFPPSRIWLLSRLGALGLGMLLLAVLGTLPLGRGPAIAGEGNPMAPTSPPSGSAVDASPAPLPRIAPPRGPPSSEATPQPQVAIARDTGAASPVSAAMPTGLEPVPSSTDAPRARRATADAPVFLNSASLDELQRLPGIGPKRAKAIFDLRVRLGRFRHVEDLGRVKGIGKATIKRLKPLVRLDAPP